MLCTPLHGASFWLEKSNEKTACDRRLIELKVEVIRFFTLNACVTQTKSGSLFSLATVERLIA